MNNEPKNLCSSIQKQIDLNKEILLNLFLTKIKTYCYIHIQRHNII